jgi:nitric oxide reductase large subunit
MEWIVILVIVIVCLVWVEIDMRKSERKSARKPNPTLKLWR